MDDSLSADYLAWARSAGEQPSAENLETISRVRGYLVSGRPDGSGMNVPIELANDGDIQFLLGTITGLFLTSVGTFGMGRDAKLANALASAGAKIIKLRRAYVNN